MPSARDWPTRLAAAAFALVAAADAQAQILWQNVERGMSAEEVRRAQPRAVPYEDPSALFNGARCLLRIEDYEFGGQRLTVCFYMLAGRLHQVTLKLKSANEAIFHSLAAELRERHGSETGAGAGLCVQEILRTCRAEWPLPGGVRLHIGWYGLGADRGFLNVNYQASPSRESCRP